MLYWYKSTNTDAARRSSLLREVPYDPALKFLFFGEEMSMLARMWTSGYDIFAPAEAVVFHLWTRDYRPSFSTGKLN